MYLVNITDHYLNSKYLLRVNILIFINLILLGSDIKESLRPNVKLNKNLSVFYWNVNSIVSHNF